MNTILGTSLQCAIHSIANLHMNYTVYFHTTHSGICDPCGVVCSPYSVVVVVLWYKSVSGSLTGEVECRLTHKFLLKMVLSRCSDKAPRYTCTLIDSTIQFGIPI